MKEIRQNLTWIKRVLPLVGILLVWVLFPNEVALAAQLILGGTVVAFLVEPLVRRLSRKMNDTAAVLLSVFLYALGIAAALFALAPPIIRQAMELMQGLPHMKDRFMQFMTQVNDMLMNMGLPQIQMQEISLTGMNGTGDLISGTVSLAGSVAGAVTRLGLSAILGIYFLMDRQQMGIRLELVVPQAYRGIALKMTSSVRQGLHAYLRGQLTIALMVGALAAAGLWAAGVRQPLALGAVVGLFNVIPYFGPIIGGIPAILTALGQDIWTAVFALAALVAVQQIDGMILSPRIMSGVIGLSPVEVLLALAVGGSGWGVPGMLFALPTLLIVRICFRVWATRNEMIEKPPKV